jgi:SAM-dependent methyltransferase
MWHDVECGRYAADLPLWHELARDAAPGAVLDVGAGTGRVALRLAAAGHAVTALDRDPQLLSVLGERARAAGLAIETMVADAAGFDVAPRRFGLVAVPMQTLQLLDGPDARAGFLAAARRALVPGGRVAVALAVALESFEAGAELPPPDLGEAAGFRFVSQPVAVRDDAEGTWIERIRVLVAPDGGRTTEPDVVHLARLTPERLALEAAAHGFGEEAVRHIPETEEHVGSEVVLLRA